MAPSIRRVSRGTSRAVDGVTVDKLDDGDSGVVDRLQLVAYHLQDVLVRQKRTRELEADGERMWFGGRREADDRSRDGALADAEVSHSVYRRSQLVVVTNTLRTNTIRPHRTHDC